MASSKRVLKVVILVVLLIFLLSTGLISVLYLGGNKNASNETGDMAPGQNIISTGMDSMGL